MLCACLTTTRSDDMSLSGFCNFNLVGVKGSPSFNTRTSILRYLIRNKPQGARNMSFPQIEQYSSILEWNKIVHNLTCM